MFPDHHLQQISEGKPELSIVTRIIIALAIAGLTMVLLIAVSGQNKAAPQVALVALETLSISGVENPVTAVLLNFRSYDTLLEVAVLLIVAVAFRSLKSSGASLCSDHANTAFLVTKQHSGGSTALNSLLSWLVSLSVLMGGYLLWTGAYHPGGAFQAGAIFAGAGVALALGERHYFYWGAAGVRLALCLGLVVFTLAALANAIITGTTLQYPVAYAGTIILVVEIAATVSIAVTLLLLFDSMKTLALPKQSPAFKTGQHAGEQAS